MRRRAIELSQNDGWNDSIAPEPDCSAERPTHLALLP
jgi:hypothetical protein